MKKIFILLICIFAFIPSLNAACNDKEINDWAEIADFYFILQQEEFEYDENGKLLNPNALDYNYYLILDPPMEGLDIEYRTNLDNDINKAKYYDVEKTYVIGSDIHFKEKKYTITINVSKEADVCAGEKLKTVTFTVPGYNMYAQTEFCDENPDEDICNPYTNDVNSDEFNEKNEEFYEEKNKSTFQKILEIILEYALYVLIPVAIITIIYVIRIKKLKKENDIDIEDEDDNKNKQKNTKTKKKLKKENNEQTEKKEDGVN